MVVFNMHSKRIRKPNVRLWEVGDVSAAFASSVSQSCKETLGQEKWIYDPYLGQESEHHPRFSGPKNLPYFSSDLDVSPRTLDDSLCNRENNDPNSVKPVCEEVSKSKPRLDFGNITRKARLMRRRRRSQSGSSSLFNGLWSTEVGLGIGNKYGKGRGRNNAIHSASVAGFKDSSQSDADFKDSSDDETPSVSKQVSEAPADDNEVSAEMPWNSNEYVGKTNIANVGFPRSNNRLDRRVHCNDSDVNSVKGWLEQLGYGNLALLFEIHEVDEEALPLLTFEDLKDMGILAVGPRRKLFSAIQQLRHVK